MATRKKIAAALKATEVLEKQPSEAAKRRLALSLIFVEGEDFELAGLPEDIDIAAMKMYIRDAKGEAHLADVMPERTDQGAFKGTFPDLYTKEEPETYAVCGHPIPVRSYTQDEYFQWRDLAQKHKLAEGQAKMQKIRIDTRKAMSTGVDVDAAKKRLPTFQKAYDDLIKKESENPFAFSQEQQEQLDLAVQRIKGFEAVISEGDVDPIAQLEQTSGLGTEFEQLAKVDREACLEFVHQLATQDGLTKEPFEEWRKRANGIDFENVQELMNVGNDYWLFGTDAEPLSRTDRRRLMREVNKELRKIAKETLNN